MGSVIKFEGSEDIQISEGRVIRINDFWSVIQSVNNNKVYIWGDASGHTDSENVLEIISDYKLK